MTGRERAARWASTASVLVVADVFERTHTTTTTSEIIIKKRIEEAVCICRRSVGKKRRKERDGSIAPCVSSRPACGTRSR